MSIKPPLKRASTTDAATLRTQADALLQRLLADRETSEQRLAAAGKRDPLKTVTGSTALERAILATRGMIAEMDLMLAASENNGVNHAQEDAREPAAAPILRPLVPGRQRSGAMLFGKRPVAATA